MQNTKFLKLVHYGMEQKESFEYRPFILCRNHDKEEVFQWKNLLHP